MNLKEPSAEIDLAVAKAAGIRAFLGRNGRLEVVCILEINGNEFRPSRDMNHAMEAAEKVGLLSPQGHQGFLHGSVDSGYVVSVRSGKLYIASTGPLAICAAILATEKGKPGD